MDLLREEMEQGEKEKVHRDSEKKNSVPEKAATKEKKKHYDEEDTNIEDEEVDRDAYRPEEDEEEEEVNGKAGIYKILNRNVVCLLSHFISFYKQFQAKF